MTRVLVAVAFVALAARAVWVWRHAGRPVPPPTPPDFTFIIQRDEAAE